MHHTRFRTLISCFAAACMLSLPLMFGSGCKRTTSERDISFLTPDEGMKLVEGGGSGLRLGGKRSVVWIDPRTRADYEAGHIPGAINVPYQEMAARESEFDTYDIIIVYGDDYNDPKSHGMSKRLLEFGHDARTLRGGLRAWRDAGRELEMD